MRITVHRGLREIGGNIIEVSSETTRILIDAGVELDAELHPVDFQELIDNNIYSAIFISHYHADHIGLLENARNLPDVFMGETAYRLYSKAREYMKKPTDFAPSAFLENGNPVVIGDISVTPILADHSAVDAYSFVIENNGTTMLYTGDFRGNGRKSFQRYLESLPERLDALVCEGTTLSRSEKKNVSERELETLMYNEIRDCSNQAFVMLSAMNIDRVVTAYKASTKANRTMMQDTYLACISSECAQMHIPTPKTFNNVYVYTAGALTDEQHSIISRNYGRKFISRERTASMQFTMCIRASRPMLENIKRLDKIRPLTGSVLIYSMWEGYKQKPEMQSFLDETEKLGIKTVSIHTSGHADADNISKLVERTNPINIIPVHTENEQWFEDNFGKTMNICTSTSLEVL